MRSRLLLGQPSLVLACLAALSCANNPWTAQRDYLKAITPKNLEQTPTSGALSGAAEGVPVRKLKVRVWADSDYRGQTLRWEERVRESWSRASDFTRDPFGVEFELVAVTEWDHRAPLGTTLEPVLDELERQDAGDDVDLVVAYVSALTAFTSSYHQLGIARRPGHHIVLRGIDNAEETDIVERSVRQLGDDEKRPVLRARKQHKETSVVLHEWAHALGSFHDRDIDKLMSPTYSPSHEKFSPMSEAMIRIGLEHHPRGLKDTAEQTAWLAEVKVLLDPIPENAWARGEHEQYVAWMEHKPARTALAGADLTVLNMVIDKLNAGQSSDALAALRPLAARFPHDERVQGVLCSAAERAHAADADDVCVVACEGAGSILACLNVADAALTAGKDALVREQLRALEPKVKDRQTWAQLAGLYRRAQCPTWAEQAAAHAEMTEAASQIAEWASRTRRWYGLEAFNVEDEGPLLSQYRRLGKQLDARDVQLAASGVADFARRYPKAALPRAVECELALRSKKIPAAMTACNAALALASGCGYAHYLLGVAQQSQGHQALAATHLEAALDIEPTNDDAWKRLFEAYKATGNAAALEAAQGKHAQSAGIGR